MACAVVALTARGDRAVLARWGWHLGCGVRCVMGEVEYIGGMKTQIRGAALLVAVLVGGCVSIPREADGIALECNVCETMWVRLDRTPELAGNYRISHRPGKKLCPECQKIGAEFLRTGQAPASCAACGGTLTTGVVQLYGGEAESD